jgi:methionine biosynthesis protein MetW
LSEHQVTWCWRNAGRRPHAAYQNLPATWYDTPNIHFCTIKDFVQLCGEINVKMERAVALDLYGRPLRLNAPWWFWNMFGEQGVFLLSRAGKGR